ncbi:MAG: hypothetical protein R2695_09175 [Acidimicrobiales bacterium]
MFDGNWRSTVDKGLTPIGQSLRRTGITADVITVIGIAMATVARGHHRGGPLPGRLPVPAAHGDPRRARRRRGRASGTGSDRGAFFDSVSDRLTDALLFCGVAWYLAATSPAAS